MSYYWIHIFLHPKETIKEILEDPDSSYGFWILMICLGLNMVTSLYSFDPSSLPEGVELPFNFWKVVLIATLASLPVALAVSYVTAWSSVVVAKWFGKDKWDLDQPLLLILWTGYVQFIPNVWSVIGNKIAHLDASKGIFYMFVTSFFTIGWLAGVIYGAYLGVLFFKEALEFDWWRTLNYLGVVGIIGGIILLIPILSILIGIFFWFGGMNIFNAPLNLTM